MKRNISTIHRSSNLRGESVKSKRNPKTSSQTFQETDTNPKSKRMKQTTLNRNPNVSIKTAKYSLNSSNTLSDESSKQNKRLNETSQVKLGSTQYKRCSKTDEPQQKSLRNPKKPEIFNRNEFSPNLNSNQTKNKSYPHYSIKNKSQSTESTDQDISIIDQSLSNSISISNVTLKVEKSRNINSSKSLQRKDSSNSSLHNRDSSNSSLHNRDSSNSSLHNRDSSKSLLHGDSSLSSARTKPLSRNSSSRQSKEIKTNEISKLTKSSKLQKSNENIKQIQNKIEEEKPIELNNENQNEIIKSSNMKFNMTIEEPKMELVEQRPPLSHIPENAVPISYDFFNKLMQNFQIAFQNMQTNLNGKIGDIERKIALLQFKIAELQD